jgi:hypothetical protein
MNNINRFLLKGFIITVFFFYYEMRFFPLTLHSIFLFLGLLSMVISLAITTTKNGLAAVKIPHDVIIALALSIVIIIGFVLNISTATFSNLQAYLLGLICYIFVRVNGHLIQIDWFFEIIQIFLLINSLLILLQFTTGRGFVASYFAAGDPLMVIPSGVSDGPTKNGMLHAFAMSLLIGELLFSEKKRVLVNLSIIIIALPGLILSASRAAVAGFLVVMFVALVLILFYRNKNLIRNKKGMYSVFILLSAVLVIIINFGLVSILDHEDKSAKAAADIVLYKFTASDDDSYSDRFENIEKVKIIAFKSLAMIITFGIGVGSFETINQGFNIHNSYLEIFLQTGLLGTILFLIIIFFVLRNMFRSKQITKTIPVFFGLFSIMVFMLFHDILRGRIFWLPLALLMVYSIPNKSVSEEVQQS